MKFMIKKEKSRKNIFYSINGGETPFSYTFHFGYTYRADCSSDLLLIFKQI